MTQASSSAVAAQAEGLAVDVLDGTAAPPSANGELVFASPHEARLFGMAHSLVHAGVFDWETFRAALIVAIAEADADAELQTQAEAGHSIEVSAAAGMATAYYRCFAQALEQILAERNLIPGDKLSTRTKILAARPSGHDHDHDHDHESR